MSIWWHFYNVSLQFYKVTWPQDRILNPGAVRHSQWKLIWINLANDGLASHPGCIPMYLVSSESLWIPAALPTRRKHQHLMITMILKYKIYHDVNIWYDWNYFMCSIMCSYFISKTSLRSCFLFCSALFFLV